MKTHATDIDYASMGCDPDDHEPTPDPLDVAIAELTQERDALRKQWHETAKYLSDCGSHLQDAAKTIGDMADLIPVCEELYDIMLREDFGTITLAPKLKAAIAKAKGGPA